MPGTDDPPPSGLAQSSGVYRALLDSMSEGVSLARADGVIIYANPAEDRMFGYPSGGLVGQSLAVQGGYPPEEGAALVAAAVAEIQRTGHWSGEWLNRRRDGSLFETFSRISAVEFEDRPHWLFVHADITVDKAAVAALRESETRLAIATEAAALGVWDWDISSGRMNYSARARSITGLPAEGELTFEDVRATVHPDDLPRTLAMAERALDPAVRSREPYDYRIILPGGEVRHVLAHGEAVFSDDDGEPRAVRYVGAIQDITERRRLEDAVAAGAERLRAQAESLETAVEARTRERDRMYALSNDLFAVAGMDGYLKTINPAWSRLLGFGEAEILARPFAALIHPEDKPRAAEVAAALASGTAVQRFEDRLLCADGGYVWIAWAAVPEGDVFYAVGRDVTRDKEREEALRQSQKMEAVGQLTGGIAHDFNNLLQAVHGNLDLIRRRAEDDRIRRWAAHGLQAAERGAKLTAQLLAFSRAQKPELRPVAAAALVADMEDMLRRALGPMVRLRLDLADDGAAVLADSTQLEMALLNLAINARDAMPEGGELAIRTSACALARDSELPAGDYLRIEVCDDGAGMPPEVLERAFDPFFTTKGVGKGTGLGLSQVYGMARQAGGAARITTRPGEGTTVALLLRRTASDPAQATDAAPEALAGPAGAATVLVVDDDPDVRRFLTDSLEALGYTVLEAADGFSGLDSLDRFAPDLLLVDFAMPGMTGAEVADAARRRRPDMPIVFASGYADTAAIDAAVGPDAPMLRKPFRMEELEAVISNALALP